MVEIKLIHTHFSEPMPDALYNYYLHFLSNDLQIKNKRFRKWQDRHTHLFGKIILIHLTKNLGLGKKILSELQYNKYRRPCLPGNIDFNISHTGSTVACAIANRAKVGLDIEEYSDVDFSDFSKIHNEEQWKIINSAEEPKKAFFDYWTVKESVIKADGKGLSNPLNEITIDKDQARQNGIEWYLKRVNFHENIFCCLACDQIDFKVILEEITQEQIYAKSIC